MSAHTKGSARRLRALSTIQRSAPAPTALSRLLTVLTGAVLVSLGIWALVGIWAGIVGIFQ
ncbi:hypothetical protein [Microbacterium sp. LWS13-1.2]|uniref:Uncharacterized protein n=1 Tax=Microbacterium sp. LWS13-1.2 TaxID=3135264 RepID=A0AAU6SGR6_9MICO